MSLILDPNNMKESNNDIISTLAIDGKYTHFERQSCGVKIDTRKKETGEKNEIENTK